jgi:hypothetical protein
MFEKGNGEQGTGNSVKILAKRLIQQAQHQLTDEATQNNLIDLIETIVIYKLPQKSNVWAQCLRPKRSPCMSIPQVIIDGFLCSTTTYDV